MAMPEQINKIIFRFIADRDIFFFEKATTNNKNTVPMTPRAKARMVVDNGMYFTNMPIVPKITIDIISFNFDIVFLLSW